MAQTRIAYMPLATYPEAVPDESIVTAVGLADTLGCQLHVTAFSFDIPHKSSPFGGLLVPGLAHAAEEKSKTECHRLQDFVRESAGSSLKVHFTIRQVVLSAAMDTAAAEARYFDLAILPWGGETVGAPYMTEAVVFGSGRPTIVVPSSALPAPLDHLAIAWDASPVAARALGDALPLLAEGGHVSVLTVNDEKPLGGSNLAGTLASWLKRRGYSAKPVEITLGKKTIAEALQDHALTEGAQVLAMGGFGHSRIRDFILGGATNGVLSDLRLPVLLSH